VSVLTKFYDLIKRILGFLWLIFINLQHGSRVIVNGVFDFSVVMLVYLIGSVIGISIFQSQKFEIFSFVNTGVAVAGALTGLAMAYASILDKEDPLRDYVVYGAEQCFRATIFLFFAGVFSFSDNAFSIKSSWSIVKVDADPNFIYWSRFTFKIISSIYVSLAIYPFLNSILYLNSVLNFKSSRRGSADFIRIQKLRSLKFQWITLEDHKKYNSLAGTEVEKIEKEIDKSETKQIANYYGIAIPEQKSELKNPNTSSKNDSL
jgi:uncharacterized membrane protein YjfL (UPF0719 family)